ncbi:Pre mRNA splicing factor SYF1 [Fasciola hepatica]|uniref:Pre mRNA splicing factor SYF1 n=1 Tax=Fasciola hepatica TaxID=6192 RepID=A0A4E0S159_FASHE|nr:Pre mRNA splicing factor SYF1 [Fasciola hepatica]
MDNEEEDLIMIEEQDRPYEEDIIRNPHNVKSWLRYIEMKSKSPPKVLYMLYERALKQLPGSYKLWYRYLRLRRIHARRMCPGSLMHEETNNAHERALVTMHKMPRIWTDYLLFLMSQGFITRTRRTFDRALKALPVTQHDRIWTFYLRFADKHGSDINETCVRIYRRYVRFAPDDMERFVEFLMRNGNANEASMKLAEIINDDNFISRQGKSKFQLWQQLCSLLVKNPTKISSLKPDPIIRQGIHRYTDQVGLLWNSLADYHIRCGNLPRARDVYAEALATVMTVRDFTQVFDAYAEFEESIAKARMEALTQSEESTAEDELEVELYLARLESLMDQRPLLLNSVLLRQNPHNVADWLKRVELLKPRGAREQISAFMEAITSVDPAKATAGRPSALWIGLARLYEEHHQLDDARVVFEKATGVAFTHVEDLAAIWCEWAEMELRHDRPEEALRLLGKATAAPPRKVDYYDRSEPVQARLHKSLKLWTLYTDLEESLGTFETTKAAYDRMIDLRIATPQIIMNYALFLEELNYFEEAFKAYEKGVALFRWPNVYDIWAAYLAKFMERYGGTKLERARDLFEQCLEKCPAKYAKALYLLYARLEEQHGLARRAIRIYERATEAVLQDERFEMFNIYIQRIADLHGVTHTRPAYEQAIERLPEQHARQMCLRFADLERKLGEIDRARAIYAYCAQMCDPRTEVQFWQTWKEFEVAHGNEDTLREMLRIRRSVQATYNTRVSFIANQLQTTTEAQSASAQISEMQKLEQAQAPLDSAKPTLAGRPMVVFQSAGVTQLGSNGQSKTDQTRSVTQNKEAINIDDVLTDDDDDADATGLGTRDGITDADLDLNLEKQPVPSAVFGGLKADEDD